MHETSTQFFTYLEQALILPREISRVDHASIVRLILHYFAFLPGTACFPTTSTSNA